MALHRQLHQLHLSSLPAVLDTLRHLYAACPDSDALLSSQDRLTLISNLTGRLSRQLRQLRPQDACRALQAVARLGLMDQHLSAGVARLVPSQLSTWPAVDILHLLEGYAAAGNRDAFMVASLRQALLPIRADAVETSPIDSALLSQLDDVAICQAAQAFAALNHPAGILAVLGAIQGSAAAGPRELQPSCAFVLSAILMHTVPSIEVWEAALLSLSRSVSSSLEELRQVLTEDLYLSWCARGDPCSTDVDTVLLGILAFPTCPQSSQWQQALASRVHSCSFSLLPGLLLLEGNIADELLIAAEKALLSQLATGAELALPVAVAVAALRALARRASLRVPMSSSFLSSAERLVDICQAKRGDMDAKGLVRVFVALRSLGMELPPVLIQSFTEVSSVLSPAELIYALRVLEHEDVKDPRVHSILSAIATRAMSVVRSSRQAWELHTLSRKLNLDVGEVTEAEGDWEEVQERQRSPRKPISKEARVAKAAARFAGSEKIPSVAVLPE